MLTIESNIYIFHYSRSLPFHFKILYKKDTDILVIKPLKKEDIISFSKYDPIVVCVVENEDMILYNCDVLVPDLINNVFEIKVDLKGNSGWVEKRDSERNPVSLFADVRTSINTKRSPVLIKDISYSGMLIYSKFEIPQNEEFDIDLYADKKVFFLKAKVVRTIQRDHYFEQGLVIVYSNYNAIEAMKQYVSTLQESHMNAVRTLEIMRVKA